LSAGDIWAVVLIEDIANGGSITPWQVLNIVFNIVVAVRQGNEHVSSSVSIEIVSGVFLLKRLLVALSLLSSIVYKSGLLVKIRISIHILPERLSILRIVTTRVSLFTSIVVERNTPSSHRKPKCIGEHVFVIELVQESSVVVVVNKDA